MERPYVYPAPEFYARSNAYRAKYGLGDALTPNWDTEAAELKEVIGEARGRKVLDCSCGWGAQTIALAKMGWQVTAADISESNMALARRDAQQEGVTVDFQVCDMRRLGERFHQEFDWVVSCNALYEIISDVEIHQALRGIFEALKPGGKAYFRLKDMDFLADEERPRHWVRREWQIPNGRVFEMNDWEYISQDEVITYDVFLREDENFGLSEFGRWTSETIGSVHKILRKTQFEGFLREAGFEPVDFLLPPHPWMNYRVVATRPG